MGIDVRQALIVPVAVLAVACSHAEADPCRSGADPSGPFGDIVPKTNFDGEWRHTTLVVDVERESPLTPGAVIELAALRWQTAESYLAGYQEREELDDPPIIAFAVHSHVELGHYGNGDACVVVSQSYEGEELNIIDYDRSPSWYDRNAVRVDWVQELVASPSSLGIAEDRYEIESLSAGLDDNNPEDWQPVFERRPDGGERLTAFEVTGRYVVVDTQCPSCTPAVVSLRHSLTRRP